MKPRRDFMNLAVTLGAATVAGAQGTVTKGTIPTAPTFRLKYSICNEVFEKRAFRESCKLAKSMGYTGLEIAPFTLGENVRDISADRRKELRAIITGEGLTLSGMH